METASFWLSMLANIAEIFTALVAVTFWIDFKGRAAKRQKRLEDYLRSERPRGCSMTELVAYAEMTEEQVFEAAHSSTKIESMTSKDEETGEIGGLYFAYRGR